MFTFHRTGTANKRKNSLSICTEEPSGYPQQQQQQRKKREKVTPLSLLQQIDYKQHQYQQPSRKNELEFLASLIAKNAPTALSTTTANSGNNYNGVGPAFEHSSVSLKKDLPSSIRCDRCFFAFHSKEQLISHKCINSSSWFQQHRAPPPPRTEKHHHHPLHVNTPGFSHGGGGLMEPSPSTSINPQFHSYYQNLSHTYPSPPMEPMKPLNASSYKSCLLPLKNF